MTNREYFKYYLNLTRSFLANELSAEKFTNSFMEKWLKEKVTPEDLYSVLESMFCSCESYTPMPPYNDTNIDEKTLRQEIEKNFEKLNQLLLPT